MVRACGPARTPLGAVASELIVRPHVACSLFAPVLAGRLAAGALAGRVARLSSRRRSLFDPSWLGSRALAAGLADDSRRSGVEDRACRPCACTRARGQPSLGLSPRQAGRSTPSGANPSPVGNCANPPSDTRPAPAENSPPSWTRNRGLAPVRDRVHALDAQACARGPHRPAHAAAARSR